MPEEIDEEEIREEEETMGEKPLQEVKEELGAAVSLQEILEESAELYDKRKSAKEIVQEIEKELGASGATKGQEGIVKEIAIDNIYNKKVKGKETKTEMSVKCSSCGEENFLPVEEEDVGNIIEFECPECNEDNEIEPIKIKKALIDKSMEEEAQEEGLTGLRMKLQKHGLEIDIDTIKEMKKKVGEDNLEEAMKNDDFAYYIYKGGTPLFDKFRSSRKERQGKVLMEAIKAEEIDELEDAGDKLRKELTSGGKGKEIMQKALSRVTDRIIEKE